MRFYTCSLFRIRNVEIISKWGSIPAVSQQCIFLESAVVVDAEHQFWIRGHVKAEIWKCHLFGESWFFLESNEDWNIDRNFLAKCKFCDKIFFDSAQRYRAMHEVRQSFAILKSQACTTTASWEFCVSNLYKSDVHWAIYIWWESSELTILMSQDLSRIKVSWFRRDVVCDQPLLTKTPSKG